MDTSNLSRYAPKARRDFIAAVTRCAAKFGLTAKGISPAREQAQLVFIEEQPYPKDVGAQRQKLAARIEQQGFQQVMEAAAYTWFNRFAAVRFMAGEPSKPWWKYTPERKRTLAAKEVNKHVHLRH